MSVVEVPGPTQIQRVPDERTDPLVIDHEYPPGELLCGHIEDRLLACEATVERANADRDWIRNRQYGRKGQ